MNDKEFKDCMNKLVEAIDSLNDITDKMSNTVSKMIDYCTVITLVMFIIFITVILF